MQLTGQICKLDDLSPQDRQQMYALMQRYYDNVRPADFERDLREKQHVIVAREPDSETIVGFSTQAVTTNVANGQTVRILFSGDTIIDRQFWSRNPLARLWGHMVLALIDKFPEELLYWFLISKGYKTYRFLPVFFREFYPRHDQPTPDWAAGLIATLATQRFGDRFDHRRGIVTAGVNGCHLKTHVAELSDRRLRDPDIAFFNRRNPGHSNGDELCCIAPLTRDNFSRNAWHVIGEPLDQPCSSQQ